MTYLSLDSSDLDEHPIAPAQRQETYERAIDAFERTAARLLTLEPVLHHPYQPTSETLGY